MRNPGPVTTGLIYLLRNFGFGFGFAIVPIKCVLTAFPKPGQTVFGTGSINRLRSASQKSRKKTKPKAIQHGPKNRRHLPGRPKREPRKYRYVRGFSGR